MSLAVDVPTNVKVPWPATLPSCATSGQTRLQFQQPLAVAELCGRHAVELQVCHAGAVRAERRAAARWGCSRGLLGRRAPARPARGRLSPRKAGRPARPGPRRIQANGHVPLLELETEGALRVRAEVPGAVTIFISATVDEPERRLRERATESTGEIGERIALARKQLEEAGDFDYIVRNEELEPAVEELVELVRGLLTPAGTMSRP